MIIRSLIVIAIFAAWLKLIACEIIPDPGPSTHDDAWPDVQIEPDAGRGGYFGRPDGRE